MDPDRPVGEADLAQLAEAVRLSPSSVNLQLCHLIVVRDRALLEKLAGAAWVLNRQKVSDCVALFVLTVKTDLRAKTVERFLDQLASDKGVDRSALAEMEAKAKGFLLGMAPDDRTALARRQAFLAFGTLLTVAASLRIDACQTEGFVAADYDRILGCPKRT